VSFKSDIPFKITRDDTVVFEMSDDDIEKRIRSAQESKRELSISRFPCKFSKGSVSAFLDRLSHLPQTAPDVSASIKDGTYLDEKASKVGWWGSFSDAGGYANMNREIVRRLHNHHIIPYVRMYPTISQIDPPLLELLNQYADLTPKNGSHPFVYAYTPMPHEYHGGKRIFFTMMETASLHQVFVDHCNRFSDEVWVPSVANKELFERGGVNKKIKVVPLGIDEILYFNSGDRKKEVTGFKSLFGKPVENGLGSFKFLTVIQWNFRKGFDALLQSFVRAFDGSDDVCLVIATQHSYETVINDLKPFLLRGNNLPQIVLYNHILPTVDMPGFYRNFDCYIHMSRGEGFSLTQIEAGACGLPVISNFHSGMTEYLTEENSFPIECKELEKCCDKLASICFFYQNQYLWKVGEKQIQQAVDYMRYVVSNYDEALKKAALMRSQIVTDYTWEKTARRVARQLGES
jgi:glycosyltransferase involved in cell wall biosynthesis